MHSELRPGRHYRPEEVLGQAGRMLLLDDISAYGPDWVEARVRPHRNSTFADEAGVPSWAGVEYMAQTASAFSGILQRQAGEDTSIALLLGTRRYQVNTTHFAFEIELRVRAQLEMMEPGGLAVFDCTICDANNDQVLASARIKAYRPPDIQQFLEDAR